MQEVRIYVKLRLILEDVNQNGLQITEKCGFVARSGLLTKFLKTKMERER